MQDFEGVAVEDGDDRAGEVGSENKRVVKHEDNSQKDRNSEARNSHEDCLGRRGCQVDLECIANLFLNLCA